MRYIIGIDLGTTNSSLSYVDLDRSVNPTLSVKTFLIPQLGRGASQQDLAYLPSCCYIFDRSAQVKYKLPWGSPKDHIVGKLAYEEGIKVPVRLIQSAKSWHCHDHASRKLAILPSEASQEIERISPVEAASRVLSHFLKAWN